MNLQITTTLLSSPPAAATINCSCPLFELWVEEGGEDACDQAFDHSFRGTYSFAV
jgi:hypothetical protein